MNMERIIYLSDHFGAVAENGRLVEYIPFRKEDCAGQILRGRVDRMMPGLGAAFVDIGRNKDGFLPLKESSQTFTEPDFRSGDRILVQIRKEETGNKGAFLTRDISLAGSYLILMPRNRFTGVSARVKDPEERSRMLRTGKALAGDRFGIVMREAAAGMPEEMLREELDRLTTQWNEILNGADPEIDPEDELVRDYVPRGTERIERAEKLPPNLERQLREAEHRKIRLPNGGNIVIDRCEAMTVIDVNSASDSGEGNRRETVLRTNMEACEEIMIQVRLRNLSGILILDMIDMETEEDRACVLRALEEAFQRDRIKTVIHGYTSLGLIEMTRKRSRAAWQEQQSM